MQAGFFFDENFMKKLILPLLGACAVLVSCNVKSYVAENPYPVSATAYGVAANPPEDITQSLFSDKEANISEENIQRILGGKYTMADKLRVAVVNLENNQYRRNNWNDENYLSSRQKYLETITDNLRRQPRVESVSLIPGIMLSDYPSFTNIREAGVRMQADVVLVYSVAGGTYYKYKMFKADSFKAFATTQVLMIDTRTGMVPFTDVVTKDYLATKEKEDFNNDDAERRAQEEAVTLTLDGICNHLNAFLAK